MCLKKMFAIVIQEHVAQTLHIPVHIVTDKKLTNFLMNVDGPAIIKCILDIIFNDPGSKVTKKKQLIIGYKILQP